MSQIISFTRIHSHDVEALKLGLYIWDIITAIQRPVCNINFELITENDIQIHFLDEYNANI